MLGGVDDESFFAARGIIIQFLIHRILESFCFAIECEIMEQPTASLRAYN